MLLSLLVLAHDSIAAEYLVSDRATNRILRYDAMDGSFLGEFVDGDMATNGGLALPAAMTFAFDQDLFVTSIDLETGDGRLLRYDGETGEFGGVFASGIISPSGVHYHQASQSILVGSLGSGLGDSNSLYRFAADGSPLETINMGPISGRTGMISADDGTLLVSSFAEGASFSGSVLQYDYDASNNALSYTGVYATAPELSGANGITSDGDLFVASLFGQGVVKFDIQDGQPVGSTVIAQAAYPSDVAIGSDGSLLVTSLGNNNPQDPIYPDVFPGAVFRFDPVTGAMLDEGPFIVGGEEFQPTSILLRGLFGDFDGDGQLTANDIDLLSEVVRMETNDGAFDLNGDGLVNGDDRVVWVEDAKKTYFGDSNLDSEFNSSDLVAVFAAGEYEDEIPLNSTWSTGDWNGDGDFGTGDMVFAFEDGGFEIGPRPEIVNVPEPATLTMVGGLICVLLGRRRQ